MPQLYLASTSPRRRELLAQIGVTFEVLPIEVHEQQQAGESPETYVQRVALDKARAGWAAKDCRRDLPVLGADTEVVLDEEVLGKPAGYEHACEMLRALSDRSHRVLSAVALVQDGREQVLLNTSVVRFRAIGEREMARYWATGEAQGKAGGYAIQGHAAIFISHLSGSFSGVMGLPLYETAMLLHEYGIDTL